MDAKNFVDNSSIASQGTETNWNAFFCHFIRTPQTANP